ncbi:MAG: discoidin domain-containing protein, partial [Chloroflexi bacterium]|nr:discoidin domain-containing protein [Chloroflexota bacterium]
RIPGYGTQPGDYWSSNYDRHSGGDVKYIDVAAGDLYRSGDDEVVIAFRDDKDDLHLVLLNGDSTGGISPGNNTWNRWYWSDSGGRGYVSQVCVATGDLDGDGYNDEIVTAFVDGNYHLQVQMFENVSYPNLTNIWGKSWTNVDRDYLDDGVYSDQRLVDVTTGDLDGDFEDEVIIALVDDNYGGRNEGKVQVLVLDRTGTWSFDDSTYVQIDSTSGYSLNGIDWVDPKAVSVAAGDIDGDGKAEVCLAYDLYVRQGVAADKKHTYPHLRTYDYVRPGPGGLQERTNSHWTNTASPWDHVSRIQTAAGDIDLDGRAEIATSFRDENGELQTLVFEGESGLTQSRSYNFHTVDDSCDLGEFWIAMGDVDGDTSYGNYTGNCWETTETQVTSVLYVPPHYSAYNRASGGVGSAVGFGKSIGSGSSTATGATTSQAGSLTIDESISFADIFEVGPSFTYEYEKSVEVSNEQSTMTTDGLHLVSDMYVGIWDMVTFDKVTYWVYEYRESRSGQTFQLRIPKGYTSSSRGLDVWYSDGPTEFGNSWVPVGQNVARGRTATQSSTYSTAAASRAVDNNADGNYANGSVSHTNYEQYAWWQVDLGRIQWLDAIQLWNRTDCCGNRLSNFYVFVSDTAFTSNNPATLAADPNVWNYYVAGQAGRLTTAIPNRSGRYVRVQLAGTGYLSLAEVQVWGHPSEVALVQNGSIVANSNQWPTERPTEINDNSFKVKLPDGTYQTVDGHIQWDWTSTNGIQVDRGGGVTTWETTQDTEWTTSVETTTAESAGIGFEAKVMGVGVEGSYTYGSETRTSRAYTWSTSTLVDGQAGPLGYATTPTGFNYNYSPYIWVQNAMSPSGVSQEFMVVSYWVNSIGKSLEDEPPQPAAGKLITPTVPLVSSPSHPDPDTWYADNTVVITWTQPAGDPATIAGYRWYMDGRPDTVPGMANMGLTTTHTFDGVSDGLWYAHVRAMSDGYEWSDAGHRAIRVDTNPPQVTLALDPPQPTGNSDWYASPLTVTVNAADGAGSGVAAIETSTDGATWQPYTPLFYTTDTPTTTVWARATDAVGHTSEPVSTTFKLDVTPPSSEIHYNGYTFGVWIANVVTDTLGNQHLVLGGVISD